MKELIGKTIEKVELGNDTTLVFTTSGGEKIAYYAEGDCCSSSWFSNITGIKNLLGQTVNEVVEREEFSEEEQKKAEEEYKKNNDYEPDVLALYGFMLKTDKGTCDVEFRNESNGYYGGYCELTESIPSKLKEITEDF